MYIKKIRHKMNCLENKRFVPWMKRVYVARWWNLLGELQANVITYGAEPDKLYPFSNTNSFILYIMLLIICQII